MEIPKVINVKKAELNKLGYKDFTEWISDKDHMYIARDMSYRVPGTYKSPWCNPFPVKEHGRDKCLELYESYVRNDKKLYDNLDKLSSKTLGCWCHPKECHGDILVKLFKEKFNLL